MPLSSGEQLGPYEILSPLGAGGMGEVYKARDTRLDRTVAVKVLPEAIAKREDLLARFEREARAVASLSDLGPAWPLALKMAATVAVIAPLGFLMGIPFPIGLAAIEKWEKSAVRWAWSMNAASSVLGSAMAIFLAIYLGLYQTLVLGGLLCLVAAWVYRGTAERALKQG